MKRIARWLAGTPERRIALALVCLCAVIYIPLAGNYGLWDPWESHYSEIARQMAMRNDWVSLWWPGSPLEGAAVYHKPVLHFWLMALSMKLFGLEHGAPPADEMVRNWIPEWAARLPNIMLSLAAIWSVWYAVSRLAGRRAGALAALILATSLQWALITRQAMTDMPFVAPMTIALALGALALLGRDDEFLAPLPRKPLLRRWSHPDAPAYWVFVALFSIVTIPQLLIDSIQVSWSAVLFNYHARFLGIVAMLPYIALYLFGLWWTARAKNRRQLYLFSAYVLGGVATLAKGPAGLALPAIVLVVYLVFAGRWRDLIFQLEIPRGVLLFVVSCFPWYHSMLLIHGAPFWREFIGDNYMNRAAGRHGDRGTFEYYLEWMYDGLFPWSGLAALGTALSFARLREKGPRAQLAAFALVWLLVDFSTVSVVATKFHHYILPALPAVAILTGLLLDDFLRAPTKGQIAGLVLVAVPLTLLVGHDLAAFPPRIGWLFNYDYVNQPGTGRPYPTEEEFGDRYVYGGQIAVFTIMAALALLSLALTAWRTRAFAGSTELRDRAEELEPRRFVSWTLPALAVALAIGIASGPSTTHGLAPSIGRWAWLLPAALMLAWLVAVSRIFIDTAPRARSLAAWIVAGLAVVWTGFALDKVIVELSPHWAEKHVIAAYYAARRGPDEPLIAWQLNWRGENFYTRNEIYDPAKPATEKTVFLGGQNAEHLKDFFKAHPGKKVFFIVERTRLELLRNLLPDAAKPTMTVLDRSNSKVFLVSAQLPGTPPPSALGTRPERLDHEIR